MKVLFVNPPFVRYNSNFPKNDIKLKNHILLKILKVNQKFYSVRPLYRLINFLCSFSKLKFGVRAGSRWPWSASPPIGAINFPFIMAYATSYLQSKGIEVGLIDSIAEAQYSYSHFLKQVKNENADIVVIECSAPTIDIDLWMAKEISKFTKVALAGPHLTSEAEKIKIKHPYITYLLKGEYIKSSWEMVNTKKPGIYESEVITELDSIPFPYRNFNCSSNFYDFSMPTQRPQLQIWGSKGCPFKCSYCLWPQTMYKGKVALRDPKKIAKEIKECVKKHNYKSIFFDDDTFNLGTERISELCDELKKIGIPWTMMGRLDCSPDWLYDKMVDSGCVGMRFGLETSNVDVLKRINKGLERIDFLKTIKYLSEKYPKLMIHLTMMKNLPEQTEEIHQKDMKILKDMGYKRNRRFPHKPSKYRKYQLSTCMPFPGTRLHTELLQKNK